MATLPLSEALKDHFTLVSLGCIGDSDYALPEAITRSLTVVEVDAEGGANTHNPFHRKIVIAVPISDKPGPHTFIRNSFAGTCSLLRPSPELVKAYDMHRYCDMAETVPVTCETLPNLLAREGITTLDSLKTDIEGLDAGIIRSCAQFLGKTLCIQCELRFEPFYETEPPFHEVVSFLAEHGYEVIDIIHIDRWKYKTPHQGWQLEGRAVWADFLFFLKPDRLKANFGNDLPLAVAKQILLACMVGKKNFGEYLLQRFDAELPIEWKRDLAPLIKPSMPGLTQLRNSVRHALMPLELFIRHRLGRSRHVSVRLGR
jgi:FkbM family methyltransferase